MPTYFREAALRNERKKKRDERYKKRNRPPTRARVVVYADGATR